MVAGNDDYNKNDIRDIDLGATVFGVPLRTCIYNASGPRSGTSAALGKIASSKGAGAVLSKSATLQKQLGNPHPRTWHSPDDLASLNSEGLPNNGIDYYLAEETINDIYNGNGDGDVTKPYIVSLSGKTLEDNLEMLRRIRNAKTLPSIRSIEMNLACPNVIGKPIIAYDFEQMDAILKAVSKEWNAKSSLPPLGVKLPPYLDFQHFQRASDIINKHKALVKYVVAINTIGNAFAVDAVAEMPVISSNSGFAGLSGPAVKYTALANVRKLRELLDSSIDVVGVGGIRSGQDAFDMLLAGAAACQIGTCHWKEGPQCFDRICAELRQILKDSGYASVGEIQNQLKPWSKEGAALSRESSKKDSPKVHSNGLARTSPSIFANEAQFYKALCAILVALLGASVAYHYHHTPM